MPCRLADLDHSRPRLSARLTTFSIKQISTLQHTHFCDDCDVTPRTTSLQPLPEGVTNQTLARAITIVGARINMLTYSALESVKKSLTVRLRRDAIGADAEGSATDH